MTLSRRTFLKAAGLGAAAAGVGGFSSSNPHAAAASGEACFDEDDPTQKNTLFDNLPTCCPGEPLGEGEMRITFLGTSCIPRLSQQGVSVYVEVGPTYYDEVNKVTRPTDYAMFDCGMGVDANYIAMGIPYSRMDKIFLTHLHGDHMSELSAIYGFGEANDRKSPLYVWGPSSSGWPDPVTGQIYDDGLKGTLEHFREVWRWHTESFSFAYNGYSAYPYPTKESWGTPVDLVPVKGPGIAYDDPPNDSYALVPIELNWKKYGKKQGDNIAYYNKKTGLKITHFPAIHCRRASISYKLEWTPPGQRDTLSLIYSGDTKPNHTMLDQAKGVDILVHEMVMPPDAWARKFMGLSPTDPIPPDFLAYMTDVQNSSHTTQGALGYLLSQINPRPRLTIATHFQAQDDTIASAQTSLDAYHIPRDAYTFASDFMVFNVTQDTITQRRAVVSKFAFAAPCASYPEPHDVPKYHKLDETGDPNAQIDNTDWVPYGPKTYNENGY